MPCGRRIRNDESPFQLRRFAVHSAHGAQIFRTKKARSLCELRAIISSFLWGSHGGCARSVLDQALLSQEIGEGFEFGIPCFAETADEGLA